MPDELKITEGFVDDKMGFDKTPVWTPLPSLTKEQIARNNKLTVGMRKAQREYEKRATAEEKLRKRLETYLRINGVEIEISGCGCCDSPRVTYRVGRKTIEVVNANVSTLKP